MILPFAAGAAAGAAGLLAIWLLARAWRARSAAIGRGPTRDRRLPLPPRFRVEVPPGTRLRLQVSDAGRDAAGPPEELVLPGPAVLGLEFDEATAGGQAPEGRRRTLGARLRDGWPRLREAWPFAAAAVVYLVVRLIRLADFPIYFFTDEAMQTLLASDLVQAGFRDHLGHYFPTYLLNVYYFNLSTTVYAQVIPYLLLGKSVILTRAVAVALTVPGALAIGLALRQVFHLQRAWIGILLLSIAPAWFLHSRTAFETSAMVSFYACFLYFYLLYRCRAPAYLYLAAVFAALAFYSYASGQIVVTLTVILLGLIDLRYHWAHRRTVARVLLLGALLAAPFVRFTLQQPEEVANALRARASVWTQDLPFLEKVRQSAVSYLGALSPAYWFIPNTTDLPRHVMLGYGHLSLWTLPFALGGLAIAVRNWRSPAHRVVLVAALAAPSAAAAAGVGITRVLSFIVPAVWLTAFGLAAALAWASRRIPAAAVGAGLFVLLAGVNVLMLRDSLVNGPTWFDDYGLDGMQYGAQQVFGAIDEILDEAPETEIHLSPSWANGSDVLARFFLSPEAPVIVENADGYLAEKRELTDRMLFILTPEEYDRAVASRILTGIHIERILPFPNGRPGFYFVRMRYSSQADALLAQAEAERLRPVVDTVQLDGQPVQVTHPLFDIGPTDQMFDGDPGTLVRTYEANPARIVLDFSRPRSLTSLSLTLGFREASLTVRLYASPQAQPSTYSAEYRDLGDTPTIEMDFPGAPSAVSRMEIELGDLLDPPDRKIHIREIILH